MLIAVLNQSRVDDEDVATMTRAIASQVKLDAAPLWDRTPAAVIYYDQARAVPPYAHVITLVNTIEDQPQGVLGYHTEDNGGRLWGIVAVDPELDSGATVLTGDWSVSTVLSHEVLEMFIDANCNLWAADDHGRVFSFEVCDPVEAPSYDFDGVAVSNFVTPAWFDPLALDKESWFGPPGVWKAVAPRVPNKETPAPAVWKATAPRVPNKEAPAPAVWKAAAPPGWKGKAAAPSVSTKPTRAVLQAATTQFDMLGYLDRPFSILPGGYVVYSEAGKPQQVRGDDFPTWRTTMKTSRVARSNLRDAQGVIV